MTPALPRPTRRGFLRWAVLTGLATGAATGFYTWRIEPHWVEFVSRPLAIAHLPHSLVGSRLVQLSDLHIGPEVDDSFLLESFRRVQLLEPDFLVITGDFMTCYREEQIDHATRVLEHLPHGRLGTLAILGNHDFGHHYGRVQVAERLQDRLEGLGVTLLRNASQCLQGLTFAGIDDLWSPLFFPQRVMPTLRNDQANLVLCHNPDAADAPVWGEYRGWILCGHTHGGQCRVPGFSPPLLPVKNRRYVAGEVDSGQGRRVYINRGLGHLLAVRFLVRPEITVFTLQAGESERGEPSATTNPN